MKKILLASTLAVVGIFAANVYAKEGKIVTGNNGTKWCCPGGVKGDGCEKGVSTIPDGAACNFASKTVAIGEGINQDGPTPPVVPAKAKARPMKSSPKQN